MAFSSKEGRDKILKAAEKLVQQGKFAAAIDEYQKILDFEPNDITLLNTVGDLYVRDGRVPEATACFARVAESYAKSGSVNTAAAMFKKIIKLDPADHEVSLRLAELYTKHGLGTEARQQYLSVIAAAEANGAYERALRVRKRLADLEPEDTSLRAALAEGYLKHGHQTEAYQTYVQLGQELQRQGRTEAGMQAFQKALDLRPDSKLALKSIAECYVQLGKLDTALGMLSDMVARSPDDTDLIIIQGRTYLNARMLDEAEAAFTRLMRVDPSRYESLLEVARRFVEAEMYDRALAALDQCVDVLLERRQKKKATALLKEILQKDPDNVEALKRLCDIYTRVNEKRNLVPALNMLSQAALRRDNKPVAIEALKQLVKIEPEIEMHQTTLETLGETPAERPAAAAFPEGFESASALMEWTKAIEDGKVGIGAEMDLNRLVEAERKVAETPENYSDFSVELLEEMVNRHPEFLEARLKLLEELVAQQPRYIEGRARLKQLYLDAGQNEKASAQCLELARLYEAEGETEKAKELLLEAYSITPSLESLSARVAGAEESIKLEDIFNYQEFLKYLDREWRRAARDGKSFALAKIAVDRFNDYVDEYGLLSADYCLERVAAVLEGELNRPGDMLSSSGGETFFVLMPDTDAEGVTVVGERLRSKVESLRIEHKGAAEDGVVTISIGASATVPTRTSSQDSMVDAVEAALLQARSDGGNRIALAPTDLG